MKIVLKILTKLRKNFAENVKKKLRLNANSRDLDKDDIHREYNSKEMVGIGENNFREKFSTILMENNEIYMFSQN